MLKTFPALTGRGPSPPKALADVTNHLKLPLIWHLAAESPDAWAPGSLDCVQQRCRRAQFRSRA